jgi:hypothetical protein
MPAYGEKRTFHPKPRMTGFGQFTGSSTGIMSGNFTVTFTNVGDPI